MNLIKYYFFKILERSISDPRKIKSPKIDTLLCSFKYTLNSVAGRELFSIKKFPVEKIITTNGKFNIRKGTLDIICCLPSYESEDINELISQISKHNNSKTLFVDIGADLGTYCISVMNKARNIDSIAFEPNPNSRKILIKNIKENKVDKKIKVLSFAVSDVSNKQIILERNMELPGSSTINTPSNNQKHTRFFVNSITLDDILCKHADMYDHIFIKMDIERNEKKAIMGSSKYLHKYGNKTVLLIEDFLDSSFEDDLEKMSIFPMMKLTPYNRWYKYKNPILD